MQTIDPQATLAVHCGKGFEAGFSPYQSTRLSRYNAVALSLGADMRRREFITLLGGAATWPLAAWAQQPAKLPTIGLLGAATPTTWSLFIAAFDRRVRGLGWIEGRTIAIEYRWAEGRGERFAEIAAEFVRLKVDVIVTAGGAVLAAK